MAETAEKKKISMIPAKPQYDRSVKLADKRMKVAAYCRISTELEQHVAAFFLRKAAQDGQQDFPRSV